MSQELVEAFVDLREEDALRIATGMLEDGSDPMEVLDACQGSAAGHWQAL